MIRVRDSAKEGAGGEGRGEADEEKNFLQKWKI